MCHVNQIKPLSLSIQMEPLKIESILMILANMNSRQIKIKS